MFMLEVMNTTVKNDAGELDTPNDDGYVDAVISFPKEEYERLEKIAKEQNVSVEDLVPVLARKNLLKYLLREMTDDARKYAHALFPLRCDIEFIVDSLDYGVSIDVERVEGLLASMKSEMDEHMKLIDDRLEKINKICDGFVKKE